jgi:proteasome lid subunit RPN8/RPN11
MFYVSISEEVMGKVMEEAKETENEIIGILVGKTKDHTIVITDAISGEQEQDITRASLPPSTIAKVTDRILKGEVEGRIVGWYHSHPGYGLFMSGTDVNTQKNLQQFSSKVTALIVDPDAEEFGFFTLHQTQGIVQLNKDQVHVYGEGEELIPESFSEPPEVPKKPLKKLRKVPVLPPSNQAPPSSKILVIGVVVAAVLAAISFAIFFQNFDDTSNVSSVDELGFSGNFRKNQENVSIYNDTMQLSARITVKMGRVTDEGVRFYLSRHVGGGWHFLGNDSIALNGLYLIEYDTKAYEEGLHLVKVNFTDSLNHTWEAQSKQRFIINNIPDIPQVRIILPVLGEEISENATIIALIIDSDNNLYSKEFYYKNDTINWTWINLSMEWTEGNIYTAILNTNHLSDGEYRLKVEVEDSNLYKGEDEITVTVLNGG